MKFYPAEQYQTACHEMFARYERDIRKLIPNARVEHVGASSIPSAVSKGDLDIFVGVELGELEDAIERLTTLGFKEKLDTLRTSELCMLESTSVDDMALQVVTNGSEFECFLTFRDKLRVNPALVEQYNTLKMSCEGWPQDEYREKKAHFIEHVLALK
ncbi:MULTISPECIES: GrpB family protein [unclassified Vibrio]|uniref:GrpB family protein n=1 Tax=unclassified Vibrio TaxID=2614977 RepID=UPI00159D109D|nr:MULTISPECIES: GrpB family protein [unclassified Vibrio]NVN79855.1 GrpB family protein [Vibrio sp. Scap16]QLE94750.1 GrpB family protein [Vibrio sp. Scap24]